MFWFFVCFVLIKKNPPKQKTQTNKTKTKISGLVITENLHFEYT